MMEDFPGTLALHAHGALGADGKGPFTAGPGLYVLAKGFDFVLPTHFIWEGNTTYLTRSDMKRVMVTIREQIKYATLSFGYLSTKVIDKSTGDAGLSALVEHLARLGAPWITGIDDVYASGDELGLDVIRNVLSADLHRWHWPTRPMNSSFLRFYSLCTLATKVESAR
jgi:O-methyltransferase involved in polyketide biosynthesis